MDVQNIEASKLLALKAQESTENMEVMTKDMHILTQKTTQETVSMRIITLVTLFFLPGTFISVSLVPIMMRPKSVSHFLPFVCLAAGADLTSPPDYYEYRYRDISNGCCRKVPRDLPIGGVAVIFDHMCPYDAFNFRRMVWRLLVGKSN